MGSAEDGQPKPRRRMEQEMLHNSALTFYI
jgi:hypothetical protein